MKDDTVSNRSNSSKKSKLRFLDLSFEGKDMTFKNGEMDNGKYPHGGYKGSKKHPLSIYNFDKGKEFQKQLRDDLNQLLEQEMLAVYASPTWALDAHRWPSNSGESPLLASKFLASSKLEAVNGTTSPGKSKESGKTGVRSAPLAATNGVQYYRPNRLHHYLTATEVRDTSQLSQHALPYGRPTRTTLLRARRKVGAPSNNAYEIRRQMDHRMDEIKTGSFFSNPKEFIPVHYDVDGETFYSFLTGARYNRAHCLDSRSVTQHGVYMPRNNPMGCFVVGPKGEVLDTVSAPPDSPRSDTEEEKPGPSPQRKRPTTAPGYGRKPLCPVPPQPTPRAAWAGDSATSNGHLGKGDNDGGVPVLEAIRVISPKLSIRGNRFPLTQGREGPIRFEGKLPSVHGSSPSKLRQPTLTAAEDVTTTPCDVDEPPPTPIPTSAKLDNSTLPKLGPKPEEEQKAEVDDQQPQESEIEVPQAPCAEEEGPEEDRPKEGNKAEGQEEEEKTEKAEESESPAVEQPSDTPKDQDDVTEEEGITSQDQNDVTEPTKEVPITAEIQDGEDDVKFFLTEGGKDGEVLADNMDDDHVHGLNDDIKSFSEDENTSNDAAPAQQEPPSSSPPPPRVPQSPAPERDDHKAADDVERTSLAPSTKSSSAKSRRTVTFVDDGVGGVGGDGGEGTSDVDVGGGFANDDGGGDGSDDGDGENKQNDDDNNSSNQHQHQHQQHQTSVDASEGDDLEQGQDPVEPLKVIVTHIERGATKSQENIDEGKESIAQDARPT